ncbi:MAG TPA: hypothetical protein VFJ57_10220 [Solirubrobacterales bacterium]|nr:hypothetical protein [Solirubrobacterales bacterium]
MLLAALGALLALAGVAGAEQRPPVVVGGQQPTLTLEPSVSPRTLSKTKTSQIDLSLRSQFVVPEGAGFPPALDRLRLLLDRHLELSTPGLPTCDPRLQIELGNPVTQRCRPALVGIGEIDLYLVYPEGKPLRLQTELPFYNAGTQGGVTRFWAYFMVPIPIPAPVFVPVKLRRINAGRYGTEVLIPMPKIADGHGLTESLTLRIDRRYGFKGRQRSVATFRCANGKFLAAGEAAFVNGIKAAVPAALQTCGVAR